MGEAFAHRRSGAESLGRVKPALQPPALQPIDAGALIDASPWTLYQKLLTALAALTIVIDGFDIQILAFAIPSLMKEWHVARATFAPVLAFGLAGMAIGGPLAGYIGDRYGRRVTLIGTIAIFGLATLATAFVDSVAALAALRFITGFGAGGAVPNASALVAEYAPVYRRPVAVKLTIVCIPVGGMLGGFIAARVLPAYGWRALYMIGGIAPLGLAILAFLLLAESPRFLALRRSGWPDLARFLNRCGHRVALDSEFVDTTERKAGERAPIRELFSPEHLRDTLGLFIAFFFCLGGVYLVFGWLPALLSAQGMDVAAASSGLATYNLGGVAGVLTWAVLATYFGSRRPMLIGALGAAVSALLMLTIPPQSPTLLMAGLGLHGMLANAIQTSMYALSAHVYPTRIRASGVACASTLGRIGGILSSLFGSVIIGAGARAYWGTLAVAMLFAFVGLAIVRRHIPVSRRHSHEQ